MLENVIFDTGVDKQEIKDTLKSEVKRLGERLSVLQQDIKKNDIPVIVLFEGWEQQVKEALLVRQYLILTLEAHIHLIQQSQLKKKKESHL